MSALLAITWMPELRGILTVIIAVFALCGSVYMILGTNLGARLGFLVALTGLAGWMFLMGAIWWTYGKGLLGQEPSWKPVAGLTVLQDTAALSNGGPLQATVQVPSDADPAQTAAIVSDQLQAEGWTQLNSSLPAYQQAGSAATVLLETTGAFKAGEFQVNSVYTTGGAAYPRILPNIFHNRLDFFAFKHEPYYAVVEVVPLVQQRTEPGRAPAAPIVDTTQPHQYVFMIRDLGTKRQPAAYITIGSLIVFLMLCYLLHSRDRRVLENRSAKALPAKA
jgi:hypothetical protein